MGNPAPGALSVKEFKLAAAEVGQWLWGTAQGAFNEKQTLSQIITDAVIGMIPVVGDVTAARDLIAVGSGLATDPVKREKTTEWVLLVILIFALIPVLGGVIKGVGRVALNVTEAVAKDSKLVAKLAEDVIGFLNRIGHKNAEAWLKALNVLKYEAELLSKFRAFCDVVIVSIHRYGLRFRAVLPQSLVSRMEQLSSGFKQLKVLGDKMIPRALKDLHGRLAELQRYIHAGGKPPPSRATTLFAQTGQKTVTYAEEARLLEGRAKVKIRHAGKFAQNVASAHPKDAGKIRKIYQYEDGFPNLLLDKKKDATGRFYSPIAAASGRIKNEMISGETLYRAFGPPGSTHGVAVGKSNPVGPFWGRGTPPKSAKGWRGPCAVLDEWNRNGFLSMVHVPKHVKIPACTSTVSEQFSTKIPGQYLEGGAQQAYIEKFFEKELMDASNLLAARGGGKITLKNGIVVEVRKSNWKNVNGKIGYGDTVIPGASVVERLGVTEKQAKVAARATSQSAQATAKNQRKQ